MLDKILRFVDKFIKPIPPAIQNSPVVSSQSVSTYEIDYDLLANKVAEQCGEKIFANLEEKMVDAQVKAHFEIKRIEDEQEQTKQIEEQKQWERALHCAPYAGKCPFLKLLHFVFFPWIALWGFAHFKKEDAQTEFGMYGFIRMLGCGSLKIYEKILCLLGLLPVIFCAYLNIKMQTIDWFWTMTLVAIAWFFLFVAACVRIFRLKLDCSTNKNTIIVATTLVMTINTIVLSAIFAIIGPHIGVFFLKILGGM